jgi:hypothetical protein
MLSKKSLSRFRNVGSVILLSTVLLGSVFTIPGKTMEEVPTQLEEVGQTVRKSNLVFDLNQEETKKASRCSITRCFKYRSCDRIQRNIITECTRFFNCRCVEYFYNWYQGNGFISNRKLDKQQKKS